MKPLFYFFLTVLCVLTIACNKDETNEMGDKVALYLLQSFSSGDDGQIDEGTATIANTPLIPYADFQNYDASNHVFTISNTAKENLANMEVPVHGKAFAIAVDREIIYTGYFWPSYSSAICNWVVIDPLHVDDNTMEVKLGYPSTPEDITIPDKRNNERILEIFRRDDKLID